MRCHSVRSFAVGLCLLAATSLAATLPALGASSYCSGPCPRSDHLNVQMTGVGSITGKLFGYTDAFYGRATPDSTGAEVLLEADTVASCQQPSVLTDRRFEFAGSLPGVGAARLYLDPARVSRGEVVPLQVPSQLAGVDPRSGAFPAVNEMRFYLRLDFPEMGSSGLALAALEPLTVRAWIDQWPPPSGTVYQLTQPVQFAERDPFTGEPTGPVLASVDTDSFSCFHGDGPLEVQLATVAADDQGVALQGSILSHQTAPLDVVWHYYTRGRLTALEDPPAQQGSNLLGPLAGEVRLGSLERHEVPIEVRFQSPGSEVVTFMAGGSTGPVGACDENTFGDQLSVRLAVPDDGLSVTTVQGSDLEAGAGGDLTLDGTGFEDPLGVSVSGTGVQVTEVIRLSPNQLRLHLEAAPEAEPTLRDLTVQSRGRTFAFVEAFTVLWPPPVVHGVSLQTVTPGQSVEIRVAGDYFPPIVAVGLGADVQVSGVERTSRTELVVQANVGSAATGAADVVIVGANGTGGLPNGLTFGEAAGFTEP